VGIQDAANTGVIFDDAGDSLPAHPLYLAARLDQPAGKTILLPTPCRD